MSTLGMLPKLAWAFAPEPLVRLIYKGRLRVVGGRTIDPKAQAVGQLANALRKPGVIPTLEESRRGLKIMAAKFDEPCPAGVHKQDITLPGGDGDRPARIYDAVTPAHDKARPTLLFLHGGGWIQGDLDTHDGMCGKLAKWAGIRVISLEYRLAPEHKFPAAPDDVLAAFQALQTTPEQWGVDPNNLAVGGDSAGGNLTATLMHDLGERNLPLPKAQVMLYAGVDPELDTQSMRDLRDAYILPSERIDWYLDLYLPADQDRHAPRAAPLFSVHLAGQPDALIIAAGHDPLWDDGLAYAQALRDVGVSVDLMEYPGQIHAFMSLTRVIPQGNDAIKRTADWLARKLGSGHIKRLLD